MEFAFLFFAGYLTLKDVITYVFVEPKECWVEIQAEPSTHRWVDCKTIPAKEINNDQINTIE